MVQAGQIVRANDVDLLSQQGIELISFTSEDNFVHAVTFPFEFPTVPFVVANINSGAGPTARWVVRCIGITATGFNLFPFSAETASASWTDIPVAWRATIE